VPAEKTARVQARRRIINRGVRSSSRTSVKHAERLIPQGPAGEAATAVTQAVSALDWAAHKGVIHRNKAARQKSRLVRKLNASATAQPKPRRRRSTTAARQ